MSVVVVPGDVALKPAVPSPVPKPAGLAPADPVIAPSDEALGELAEFIDLAERVTLLCGSGCAGAHNELMQFAGAVKAPIVHAMGGKDHVEWDNPYDVGMTGLIGFSSGYYAMESCDALLMLGTDFPYWRFYPTEARVAQVDIRPQAIGRRVHVDLGIVGQVGPTLRALMPRIKVKSDRRHLDKARTHYVSARKSLDELATGRPGGLLHPQHVMRVINEKAADDAIFTPDVGLPIVWAARYLTMNFERALGFGTARAGLFRDSPARVRSLQRMVGDDEIGKAGGRRSPPFQEAMERAGQFRRQHQAISPSLCGTDDPRNQSETGPRPPEGPGRESYSDDVIIRVAGRDDGEGADQGQKALRILAPRGLQTRPGFCGRLRGWPQQGALPPSRKAPRTRDETAPPVLASSPHWPSASLTCEPMPTRSRSR